jgi:hypothetical protein
LGHRQRTVPSRAHELRERVGSEAGFDLGAEPFESFGNAFGFFAESALSLLDSLVPDLVEDRLFSDRETGFLAPYSDGFLDLLSGESDGFTLSGTRFQRLCNRLCGEAFVALR